MARVKAIEAVIETTEQPTHLSTELSLLVNEFAAAVALFEAKTVWRTNDRPYRPLLAAAQALVALGQTLVTLDVSVGGNGYGDWVGKAQAVIASTLYMPAGRNRCLWMQDHHMAAINALVALAYHAALRGDGAPVAEARAAVAKLAEVGRRGR